MPGMRETVFGRDREPGGSISRLRKDVYREAADIAYYFNWPRGEILSLSGRERRIWLSQINRIHSKQRELREKEAMDQAMRIIATKQQQEE